MHGSEEGGSSVRGFDLTSTGDLLVTSNFFGQIKLWDVDANKLLKTKPKPDVSQNVNSIAFSPDDERLVGTQRWGYRWVWDSKSETAKEDYEPVANGSRGVVEWHADGNRFASIDGDTVAIYRTNEQKPVTTFPHRGVRQLYWIDDQLLATAGLDHTIRIWDVDRGRELPSMQVDQNPVSLMGFSHNGTLLATVGQNALKIIRPAPRHPYETLEPGRRQIGGNMVRWSHDGRRIAAAHLMGRSSDELEQVVRIYDRRTGQLLVKEDVGEPGRDMDWSTDNKLVHFFELRGRRYDFGG